MIIGILTAFFSLHFICIIFFANTVIPAIYRSSSPDLIKALLLGPMGLLTLGDYIGLASFLDFILYFLLLAAFYDRILVRNLMWLSIFLLLWLNLGFVGINNIPELK